MSHTPINNVNSKESFKKQTTLLEKRMDESIPYDQKCKSSKELFKIKISVGTIIDGVEHCKELITKQTYFGHIDPFIQNTIEANFCLSETNKLMYTDLKKFQAELDRRNDIKYASKMEINFAKAKGDLISYKMESQKPFNIYTQQLNDLNQTLSEMKKELSAYQETISILSQAKEAQIKLYKAREDKELDKVIALENKVKVLDN
nr:hypothetical protein [Tanacetum cinerariifolium]